MDDRFQVSAPLLAAEVTNLIEKETVTVHGIFEIPNPNASIPKQISNSKYQ
jgi:hypothetical protein